MTRFFRHIGWAWILIAVALGVRAQLPPNITVSQSITANPQIPIYRETPRGQIMDAMITFKSAASTGRADMHVTQFDMRTFKEGDTNHPLCAWVYVAVPQGDYFRPTQSYLDSILKSAKMWDFPPAYLDSMAKVSAGKA